MRSDDLHTLPPDLPIPVDDGACRHLPGLALPSVALPSTRGGEVRLDRPAARFTVIYCYPRTGLPDAEPPGGLAAWDAIPGMRGCTPQACAYRDHHAELGSLGAEVFGVSTQDTAYQQEMAERLHLPFAVLSDAALRFTRALQLPTERVAGELVLRRLTLLAEAGRIVDVFHPVFPPDADAGRVTDWLRRRTGQ
ncbi:MAG TPA: peroxiredoxin [Gemmatimonadales bacterium]|nr:peroxiredoxin [Gemmatimonadales bacterium]